MAVLNSIRWFNNTAEVSYFKLMSTKLIAPRQRNAQTLTKIWIRDPSVQCKHYDLSCRRSIASEPISLLCYTSSSHAWSPVTSISPWTLDRLIPCRDVTDACRNHSHSEMQPLHSTGGNSSKSSTTVGRYRTMTVPHYIASSPLSLFYEEYRFVAPCSWIPPGVNDLGGSLTKDMTFKMWIVSRQGIWDNVVDTVAWLRTEQSGVRIPRGQRFLRSPKRPDRLGGPTSLLFDGHRLQPQRGGVGGRGVRLITHLYIVPNLRMSGATLLLPTFTSWRGQRQFY